MSIVSVEFGRAIQRPVSRDAAINSQCIFQEAQTISGSATTGTPVSQSHANKGVDIVRICTNDAACYFAIGSTPDPTLSVENIPVSSARRFLPAGCWIEQPIALGMSVSVITAP